MFGDCDGGNWWLTADRTPLVLLRFFRNVRRVVSLAIRGILAMIVDGLVRQRVMSSTKYWSRVGQVVWLDVNYVGANMKCPQSYKDGCLNKTLQVS